MKGAYRNLVIPGVAKAGIDGYFDSVNLHIKALIKVKEKKMQAEKVIMTLWVKWTKSVNLAITVDPKDLEIAQGVGANTGNNYTRLEMPFNSLMTVFGRERY